MIYELSPILKIQLFTFVFNLSLGLFLLLNNPRSKVNRYFWIFTLGTAGWNLSLFLAISELGQPLLWGRLAFSFASLMSLGMYLFSTVFPWADKPSKNKYIAAFLLCGVFFLVSLSNFFIKTASAVDHAYLTGNINPFVYVLYLAYYFGFLIWAVVKLFKKYRVSTGVERAQLKYVTTGVVIFCLPLFLTQLILPLIGMFQYNNLGPLFSLPMVALVSYAILKYKFLNIEVVVQWGLIYSFLLALVIDIYLGLIGVFGYFFQNSDTLNVLVSAGFTTVIGVFTIPVIERYFRKVTDRFFFRGKYDYAQALEELSEILKMNIEVDKITGESVNKLKKIFKPETVEFIVDTKGIVPCDNISEVCLPITHEDTVLGAIKLGKKLCGEIYTGEDLMLLKTFANHAAVSLEKAVLFEKVKKHSLVLEEKVKERTAEIEELQKEQKKMIIDIAHGLQTPLTVVKTELGTLKKSKKGGKLFNFEKSLDEVSKYIYSLLKLAKLEMSGKDFEKERINLSKLLQELIEYVSVLADNKKIKIKHDIAENVIVLGDKDRLMELMTNLVSNAFKFIPPEKEKKEINICLAKLDGHAIVEITDTGSGVSKQDIPKIFNRFYSTSGSEEQKGTGLGLAIARKIVENHGGTIDVDSELGVGTKFKIILPRIE